MEEEEVGYCMRRTVSVRAKKVQGSRAIDSHQPHSSGTPVKTEQEKNRKKGHCRFATRIDKCVDVYVIVKKQIPTRSSNRQYKNMKAIFDKIITNNFYK